MKTIPLTKEKVALVDDVDYEWAMQWKWQAYESKRKHFPSVWYATCKHYQRGEKNGGPTYYLHREIAKRMGHQTSEVDHFDFDGLNNQRSNLRPCSASHNQANRRKTHGTSAYKGVYWFKRTGRWMAKIGIGRTHKYLGYFDDERKAAEAYNDAAYSIYGEFALLNKL